jgi:hypothetical protein
MVSQEGETPSEWPAANSRPFLFVFVICKGKNDMTGHEPHHNPQPNHSTGPKTPEGKSRCRLNAYRHGLTGQLCVFTPGEQQAYEKHCKVVLEGLAPVGDFERDIAQSVADGRWRLKRAGAIEAGTFALGMHEHSTDNTGHAEVDNAFAQARTWCEQAHNLQLLTVYEQRIQRAVDKNMAELKTLQTERKEAAAEAMKQAKLLYQFAKAQGKPYRPEAFFTTAPEVRESVYSSTEVAREISRARLLYDAENYVYYREFPKQNKPEQPMEAAAF